MTNKVLFGLTFAVCALVVGSFGYAETLNIPNINIPAIPSITSEAFVNTNWTFSINNTTYTVRGSDLLNIFRNNCSTSGTSSFSCTIANTQGVLTVMWNASGLGTGGAVTLDQDLFFGIRGENVRSLQLFLIERGYLAIGNDTGYFGPLIENAVIQFQGSQGLPQTGYVGPLTRGRINQM